MVVLVSESDNMTRNLTKLNSDTIAVETLNTTIPLYCYTELFGYDIEANGSLGTLAVPGEILRNFSSIEQWPACEPIRIKPATSEY